MSVVLDSINGYKTHIIIYNLSKNVSLYSFYGLMMMSPTAARTQYISFKLL